MGLGYQKTDRNAFDYDIWFDAGLPNLALRGPQCELDAANRISFIGAAQTFGRFVKHPFPQQVGRFLERPVANLGFSGAGAEFYLKRPELMALLATSDTVVVQSMSARSVSAGVFKTARNNGVLEFQTGPCKSESYMAEEAYRIVKTDYGEDALLAQRKAVQDKWLEQHRELADQISGRKVFLWLSNEAPNDNLDYSRSAIGQFPHMVTGEMVSKLPDMGFEVIKCVLNPEPVQILINDHSHMVERVFDTQKFPNRPDKLRALNVYYATPALHDKAARMLCKALL
ncbi:hypothetical protein SAMN05444287_1761 [Octadecabacter temperatus]|uniref:DUF6473 domain-containing protein n=1 Tax=Octadecabacter temperatus TaxID=1458307 RepID=A0A0K0Y6Q0_9RHOB|nr:DUF6473 family protein [Octadecabacter temperatus]AKS46644.1 hypothetical protein OSB_21050 [Octadecabacter temperatus]SIO18432.1 hypothetical protein SAMN05444287_1761 [Octadecabacter temperatus]